MTRKCGDCQLCCTLLAITELGKGRNKRCHHQRFHKGCSIYAKRPYECSVWSCAWLTEADTVDMKRPDRAHYVIDTATEPVELTTTDGQKVRVDIVPIWVDPKHPEAYRDPQLLAFLLRRAGERKVGVINREFVLAPPSISGNGTWDEIPIQ